MSLSTPCQRGAILYHSCYRATDGWVWLSSLLVAKLDFKYLTIQYQHATASIIATISEQRDGFISHVVSIGNKLTSRSTSAKHTLKP